MADEQEALFNDEPVEMLAPELPVEEAPVETPEPIEPEAAAPIVEPEPTPQAHRPDAGYVPIGAVLDEREKRKALEQELAQYRQRQQPEAIDPFDDPQAFAAQQQGLVQQAIIQDRFERSNEDAVEKYGEDKVKAAVDWATSRAQQNPTFATEYMGKTRPIQWIVQQHEREATLGQIGDRSIDDFVKDYLAKNPDKFATAPAAAVLPMATPQPATPPVRVPRSLATQGSGPSDVRDVAAGALAAVDAVFPN